MAEEPSKTAGAESTAPDIAVAQTADNTAPTTAVNVTPLLTANASAENICKLVQLLILSLWRYII